MSYLNFNFVMIYIINKILILPKNHLNFLKDNIFKCLFRKYNRLSLKKIMFFIICNNGNFNLEEENITNDISNLFRLKKSKITLQSKI